MIHRFRGAINFINNTTINQHGKTQSLKELPWFVLLGPAGAGKTAMLARSNAPYVLQKNLSSSNPLHFEPSDNCDWWVTRNACIIDVPSKYLSTNTTANADNPDAPQVPWEFFLSLLKKRSRQQKLGGIVIALPLPESMRQDNSASLHETLSTLSQRINDIRMTIKGHIPCYLVVTKCDMIAGFHEFFAEASDEELTQPWGIMLPRANKSEQMEHSFDIHFNELIRKLNQQLLCRLHQERNPIARPYIKNFPLQIERLKTNLIELIKQLDLESKDCDLQGVYLTSALQSTLKAETANFNDNGEADEQGLQIFKEPAPRSRSYFIRQFITHGLMPAARSITKNNRHMKRKQYALYAASASAIIAAAALLGRDFKTGFDHPNQIQTNLTAYRHVLQQFHNPNESMSKTLLLLDALQESKIAEENKGLFKKVLSYYSDKSQKNTAAVYFNALQAFLIPEIRNYFADYLRNPINQNAESIYGVFKAYLMLGDMKHFDSGYIRTTLTDILPKTFKQTTHLLHHFDVALERYQPIELDNTTISRTRKYLLSLRGSQLGYIILKGMDSNTHDSDALLGNNVKTNALFTSKNSTLLIPAMFTGKNFVSVFEQEIRIAADEVTTGNWILGTDFRLNANPNYASDVAEQLRTTYIKQYADAWETALANIQIEKPHDLEQADAIITSMTSYDSPLLRILSNIHENTFFEPITTASPRLFNIGQLIDRNNPSKTELYQILSNLEALHNYLQPVLSAANPKKAAYQLITKRMQHQGELDPITKLRLAADQSPMPLKGWINQLTNDTWHFLLKDGMRYIDTSWSEKVTSRFRNQIAHRYPFSSDALDEVSYPRFTRFFGRPGIITTFYQNYLSPYIDTSKPQWAWKKLDGQELPFSEEGLKQIQQAMKIHHAFFPNDDNKLQIPFALRQKDLSKQIASIKLNINSKVIVDKRSNNHGTYALTWPYNYDVKFSSVELNLAGEEPIQLDFPGPWGWFRLVSQSYEGSRSTDEILLNFSKKKYPAKYSLKTRGKLNPFDATNLRQLDLPDQLSKKLA